MGNGNHVNLNSCYSGQPHCEEESNCVPVRWVATNLTKWCFCDFGWVATSDFVSPDRFIYPTGDTDGGGGEFYSPGCHVDKRVIAVLYCIVVCAALFSQAHSVYKLKQMSWTSQSWIAVMTILFNLGLVIFSFMKIFTIISIGVSVGFTAFYFFILLVQVLTSIFIIREWKGTIVVIENTLRFGKLGLLVRYSDLISCLALPVLVLAVIPPFLLATSPPEGRVSPVIPGASNVGRGRERRFTMFSHIALEVIYILITLLLIQLCNSMITLIQRPFVNGSGRSTSSTRIGVVYSEVIVNTKRFLVACVAFIFVNTTLTVIFLSSEVLLSKTAYTIAVRLLSLSVLQTVYMCIPLSKRTTSSRNLREEGGRELQRKPSSPRWDHHHNRNQTFSSPGPPGSPGSPGSLGSPKLTRASILREHDVIGTPTLENKALTGSHEDAVGGRSGAGSSVDLIAALTPSSPAITVKRSGGLPI